MASSSSFRIRVTGSSAPADSSRGFGLRGVCNQKEKEGYVRGREHGGATTNGRHRTVNSIYEAYTEI